jgi:hypothetical protein
MTAHFSRVLPAGLIVTDSLIIEAAKQRSPNMQVVVDSLLAATRDPECPVELDLDISDALWSVLKGCNNDPRDYQGAYNRQVHASAGMPMRTWCK